MASDHGVAFRRRPRQSLQQVVFAATMPPKERIEGCCALCAWPSAAEKLYGALPRKRVTSATCRPCVMQRSARNPTYHHHEQSNRAIVGLPFQAIPPSKIWDQNILALREPRTQQKILRDAGMLTSHRKSNIAAIRPFEAAAQSCDQPARRQCAATPSIPVARTSDLRPSCLCETGVDTGTGGLSIIASQR